MKKSNKLKIKDLFSQSWKVYKENWFNFILIGLIFMFVGGVGYMGSFHLNNITGEFTYNYSAIMNLISWLASAYLSIGVIRYMLNLIDGKDAKLKSIFYGVDSISHFAYVVLVGIVTGLIIVFGTVFLIVPGIIAALGLMFSKYIIIENKGGNVEVWESVKRSWSMTKKHRWKLLWICIVLALFNLVGFLALVVGLVVTIPVSSLVIVAAYRKLDKKTEVKKNKEDKE